MKFRMTLVLLFVMLFTIFNGCGGSKKADTSDQWKQATKLKPIDLTLYLPQNPEVYPQYYGNQLINKMPKELNKRLKMINTKIKIGNVVFETGFPNHFRVKESYKLAINSGDNMDLFFINEQSAESPNSLPGLHDLSSTIKYLGENNYAVDLFELFSKFAPKYYQRFEKKELDMLSYKGKLLAIPSLNYPVVTRTVAVVREDLMKNYKIKPINSMEDYENYLQTIKINEKDMVPMLFGRTAGGYTYGIFDLLGRNHGYTEFGYMNDIVYHIGDPEMKPVPWEQTEAFFEIAKKIRAWRLRGYAVEFRQPDMLDVASGKYASFISKSGAAESYNQMLKDDGGKPWKYIEYDLYPDSTLLREFNPYSLICVNPRSPNKERAIMLIELLMTDQKSYDIFTYGVENQDFTYDNKKIPKPRVPSSYILDFDSYISNNAKWCLSNIYMQHKDEKLVNEKLKSLTKKTVLDPAAGFIIDEQALSKISIDFQAVYQISNPKKIVQGESSDEEIIEYINALKPYSDARAKELQRQLDEWRSEQKK